VAVITDDVTLGTLLESHWSLDDSDTHWTLSVVLLWPQPLHLELEVSELDIPTVQLVFQSRKLLLGVLQLALDAPVISPTGNVLSQQLDLDGESQGSVMRQEMS